MFSNKTLALAAACAALIFAGAASTLAAPAGSPLEGLKTAAPTQVDAVHWRRHCHWRWGWRRCHYYGYRPYYYGYHYYRPGIWFGFHGFRHHHHHWW